MRRVDQTVLNAAFESEMPADPEEDALFFVPMEEKPSYAFLQIPEMHRFNRIETVLRIFVWTQ